MKRILTLMLTAILLLSVAGCGSTQNSGQTATQTTPQATTSTNNQPADTGNTVKPVVLQFWGAIPPENGPQELVDNWNKDHPEIQVEYTRFVNDDAGNTKLETALVAGQVDVFINYLAPSLEKRVEAGLLSPIDDYLVRDGIDLEKEFGDSNYERNGIRYFIPTYGGSSSYLLYNKDMFDAAGITIPENWTWDQFADIAKQLTKGEGTDKVFGASVGSTLANDDWAFPAHYSFGGDYYYKPGSDTESNFDDPLFLYSLKLRHRMEAVDKSFISRMSIKTTKMDVSAEFTKGKVAMVLANYALRDVKNLEKYPHDFVTSFAPSPVMPGQETVYSGGLREWISISTKSENKDQAWEFLKYYAMEGYYPMCKSNRFPAWKGADTSKVADLILGPDKDKIFDTAAFEKYVMSDPKHRDDVIYKTAAKSEINQYMGEQFEKVLLGESTPEKAIAELKEQADKAIANAQK